MRSSRPWKKNPYRWRQRKFRRKSSSRVAWSDQSSMPAHLWENFPLRPRFVLQPSPTFRPSRRKMSSREMCEGCLPLQKILMNPLFHCRKSTIFPPPPPASQENQLTRWTQWSQERDWGLPENSWKMNKLKITNLLILNRYFHLTFDRINSQVIIKVKVLSNSWMNDYEKDNIKYKEQGHQLNDITLL